MSQLRVGFAHGGGSFAGTIGRIEHGFRVRPDLCAVDNKKSPRTYLGKFWVDSLVHDDEILEHIVRVFGPARVLLGSDYPFPLGEDEPGLLVESSSRLDEATKRQILWDNAVEFLGIKGEDFL
jgi:aminocarboxymuconate-semialdehyde decarboxylase